jgi:hypothetical protein
MLASNKQIPPREKETISRLKRRDFPLMNNEAVNIE